MRIVFTVGIVGVLAFAGCNKVGSPEKKERGASWSMGDKTTEPYFVNPAFPGGQSVMTAARRVFPDCGHITLGEFSIGSDTRYDYAVFLTGREIKNGFESTYFRYLTFVKPKNAGDWSTARVFDWPDVPIGPFNGPIEVLESKGKELGKGPNLK